MTIDTPRNTDQLQALWKQAFGDPEEFIGSFFRIAYSPRQCRCVYEGDALAAMLYWFDCSWGSKRLAYLYAVATAEAYRGQGLCRALMEDTHRHLRALGYDGCILVPRTTTLFSMYEKLGYTVCSGIRESTVEAGTPLPLRQIDAEEFAALRRQYLPQNGVVQEGKTLALLQSYSTFYTGENVLLAMYVEEGKCTVCELLGGPEAAPGIVAALGHKCAKVRTPGNETPFAMYRSLVNVPAVPGYFGIALD